MASALLQFFIVLFFFSATGDACSCLRAGPIDNMCKADFVSKVLLMSPPKPAGDFDLVYKIDYQAIFLKTERFVNAENDTYLMTASSSAACGMSLPFKLGANDNTYLISGLVDENGKIRLGMCNSVAFPWFQLDPEDRKFLMTGQLRQLCIDNLDRK